MQYMTETELYHHGILGQKWGVRRFQNQDGSYTAAGKERYGIEDGKRRSLKSYALEYKDRRENKNRYTRMKKNQNLDTMSFDEMKRLQEREALKGQIQWQQKQNDPNAWKQQLKREIVSTAAKGFVEGASKELGRQVINAPVKLAGYAGDKTISAAGWSARQLVDVATNQKKQDALKRAGKAVGGEITSFTQNAAGAGQGFVREMGSQAKSFGSGASQAGKAVGANTKAFYKGMTDSQNAPGWYSGARRAAYDNGQAVRRGTQGIRNEARSQYNSFTSGARDASRSAQNAAYNADRRFSNAVRRTASSARTKAGNAADTFMNYKVPEMTYNNSSFSPSTRTKMQNLYYQKKYGNGGWGYKGWSWG